MKKPNIIRYLSRQWWDDRAYQVGQTFFALVMVAMLESLRRVLKEQGEDKTEQVYYYIPPVDTSKTVAFQFR